ncbi:DUF3316 domain-containing protein [Bacteroidales bacterium OttesenSCG-928-A17]|nr:DUF3316 domain-containing protein [Bacteroidales bacterium OttesenSCG-928-A17]
MKRFSLSLLLIFLSSLMVRSQQEEPVSLVYQSSMIGYGKSSVYDTYLSPIEYKGNDIGLYHEQMKMTGLLSGNVSAQHLLNINFSWGDNETGTATNYTGFLDYAYGLHYKFEPIDKLQLFAGSQANGLLGFVYNSRNGNNPAAGKAHINLNLSAIASYRFNIKSQPIFVRYQLNIPFLGAMFSPEFGQSYYEISLGDQDQLAHFASFHNYLSIRNIVSVEVPVNRFTFRLSYQNWVYETQINKLETRINRNSFYIGLSKNFYTVPYKKRAKVNSISVFD